MTVVVQIAVFDGVDDLDVFGPFEVLNQAVAFGAELTVQLASFGSPQDITTAGGAQLHVTHVVAAPDVLVVPGGGWLDEGPGVRVLREDDAVLAAISTAAKTADFVASVCTGAFLLAAAGVLAGHRVTTNSAAIADLREQGFNVAHSAVVDDGAVVTSGGPITSVELGLHIVNRLFGEELVALLIGGLDMVSEYADE